jgi:predicted metal-dependent HD superfamily phosphohydrolase
MVFALAGDSTTTSFNLQHSYTYVRAMVGTEDLDRQEMPVMTQPTYNACLVDAELRARAAYAEPGRHYHDERHLDDCLRQLEDVAHLNEREQRPLRWAILWHDAIYDPQRPDNEEQSAELARRELLQCGVDAADADEVARLIRLTFGHRVAEGDRLGALLVSIDLSILGSDPERYRAYVADVRHEYSHVPDDLWRSGRAAVLKWQLAADPLYPDPDFRARYEMQARRNMEDELRTLGEG